MRITTMRFLYPISTSPLRLILILIVVSGLMTVSAQDAYISDNEVNAVAEKLYCPVCENIPLDDCQTVTCLEWKEEIRIQLAQGESPQEIIDSFVARFGDNVVGVPQDPLIRALTIIMPILAGILAAMVGVATFRRFGQYQKLKLTNESVEHPIDQTDDAYRQQLEQDLLAQQ